VRPERPRYYAKDGNEMDLIEWAIKLANPKYKIIKQELVGEYQVSTVWLGLDHSYGIGPPLIFETMVFGFIDKQTTRRDTVDEGERYSTVYEAEEGHARYVKKWEERVVEEYARKREKKK
jgi:hypothetical protein